MLNPVGRPTDDDRYLILRVRFVNLQATRSMLEIEDNIHWTDGLYCL